ncbi:DUF92 domain-containing protein, partial [Paenibacillus sp. 598K]|uniref:DUF92 domain-containing protein n=1 Tax=Paenibacillus sp. 598K TaxID=1117987 RepID=UPI0021A99CEB
ALIGWRPVTPGTSGGVTALGSFAALSGAAVIGAAAAVLAVLAPLAQQPGAPALDWTTAAALFAIATAAGFIGSFADSWLGAVFQAMYRCPSCGMEIEREVHCGIRAERIRGWRWMTNDVVNLLATAFAGAVAAGIALLWL